jgi:hypothetical protein
MAIVLPLLFVLIFGIIDFGRMLNKQITLTSAAQEAARVLSVGGTTAEAAQRVEVIAGNDVSPALPPPCDPGTAGNAEVTITYDFDFITPVGLIGGGFDGEATLTGRGVMSCQ